PLERHGRRSPRRSGDLLDRARRHPRSVTQSVRPRRARRHPLLHPPDSRDDEGIREETDMAARMSRAEARRDPTRMASQPALRSSEGTIWIVVGGVFALICLQPLSLLTGMAPRESAPVAWITAIAVIVLYAALLVVRWSLNPRERRLRVMAVLML